MCLHIVLRIISTFLPLGYTTSCNIFDDLLLLLLLFYFGAGGGVVFYSLSELPYCWCQSSSSWPCMV